MRMLAIGLLGAALAWAPVNQGLAGEDLLEILKSRGIITQKEYEELKNNPQTPQPAKRSADSGPAYGPEFSGKLRFDYRYYYDGAGSTADGIAQDGFELRKASLSIAGDLSDAAGYKLKMGLDDDVVEPKDVYVKYALGDAELKLGQFKHEFGHERQVSSSASTPMERASISKLQSSRDRGIKLAGPVFKGADDADGLLYYHAGIYNGNGAGTTNNNDDLDFIGKVVVNPTRGRGPIQSWLGASFWFGKQHGTDEDDEIELKTESRSGNVYFVADIPETRSYARRFTSVGAGTIAGPWMINAEFQYDRHVFDRTGVVKGGYLSTSYFLTGEQRSIEDGEIEFGGVKQPFSGAASQWGAWEIGLRYSWFEVDEVFFTTDGLYAGWEAVDRQENVNKGSAWTLGLNWYIDDMTQLRLNWIHSVAKNTLAGGTDSIFPVEDAGKSDTEDALLLRFQVIF